MTERTRITRLAEKGSTDRAALNALLDSARVGHVGLVREDGTPVVLPSAIARDGERVLVHGSTGAGWLRALAGGAPACLTVTEVDGLVVARSAFESSMHYRSAALFGVCTAVEGRDKQRSLDLFTDSLLPGRTAEIRRPTKRELQATVVLALPIEEWSLKVSDGWPDDPAGDIAGDAWAGVIAFQTRLGTPVPAPDLRPGIDLPPSLR